MVLGMQRAAFESLPPTTQEELGGSVYEMVARCLEGEHHLYIVQFGIDPLVESVGRATSDKGARVYFADLPELIHHVPLWDDVLGDHIDTLVLAGVSADREVMSAAQNATYHRIQVVTTEMLLANHPSVNGSDGGAFERDFGKSILPYLELAETHLPRKLF